MSKYDRDKLENGGGLGALAKSNTSSRAKLSRLGERKFSNADGKAILAKVSDYHGETVTLSIRGKNYKVAMAKLSEQSQQLIRSTAGY